LVSLGRRVYLSFLFIILVSGGIICSVVDVLQQAWYYIIFILEFYSYIIKAFGFPSCFGHLVFILLLSFIIWLSNILSLSAPQEIYARNVSWALKKSIFTLYDLIIACFCPFSFWPAIELSVLRFTASCYPLSALTDNVYLPSELIDNCPLYGGFSDNLYENTMPTARVKTVPVIQGVI
jgi:hypothetical protein